MSKKIQLRIDNPCHENWDGMTPAENGRYCQSCQKNVIDFTGMTDAQIIAFFQRPSTGLCGRFDPDQLNRPIAAPARTVPWRPYLFGIALPAFLYSCNDAVQGKMMADPKTETTETVALDGIMTKSPDTTASPDLARPAAGQEMAEPLPVVGDTGLVASSPSEAEETCQDTVTLMDVIVTTNYGRTRKGMIAGWTSTTQADTVQSTLRVLTDTARRAIDTLLGNRFSIYPNPASHGSLVRVDWRGCRPGDYELRIINMAGQVLDRRKLSMGPRAIIPLSLPELLAGTYLISFSGQGRTYTERIVIR
ncbi:MAG: hypothetical protein JWP27_1679 [Flaviaesturariibacter sp.]|nr:hypothetical protein [Flaviaesturariibacter sp.]